MAVKLILFPLLLMACLNALALNPSDYKNSGKGLSIQAFPHLKDPRGVLQRALAQLQNQQPGFKDIRKFDIRNNVYEYDSFASTPDGLITHVFNENFHAYYEEETRSLIVEDHVQVFGLRILTNAKKEVEEVQSFTCDAGGWVLSPFRMSHGGVEQDSVKSLVSIPNLISLAWSYGAKEHRAKMIYDLPKILQEKGIQLTDDEIARFQNYGRSVSAMRSQFRKNEFWNLSCEAQPSTSNDVGAVH